MVCLKIISLLVELEFFNVKTTLFPLIGCKVTVFFLYLHQNYVLNYKKIDYNGKILDRVQAVCC